jgi:hypothetical protein
MNRAQRRNANPPKSNARKAGLTYLTVAGVVGGTIGLASPAHAAIFTSTDCSDLLSDMYLMQSQGGTLTAVFAGNCNLAVDFIFQQESTIIGPTNGDLNLKFLDSATQGFAAEANFSISNVNFTRESPNVGINYFINAYKPSGTPYPSLTVANVTFSNAEVGAAIYAEGNLTISDSTFSNLTSYNGGTAIYAYGATEITNSTFTGNKTVGQGQGGTVNTYSSLVVENSTFNANESSSQGGAIYALGGSSKLINNSTFVGNSATDSAAVFFSEGGVIANSTFWNNGDADTFSIGADISDTYIFGNILANDDSNVVKVIDPVQTTIDLGANLYTDTSFDDTTSGEGQSMLVTAEELKLSALSAVNAESTETVAIATDSVAYDYYTADSSGIDPTFGFMINSVLTTTDQRGASRPLGNGYDVGAYESGSKPGPSPSESPEPEMLADTGLTDQANYLGLVGLGLAAILGGTAGQIRRRKKA